MEVLSGFREGTLLALLCHGRHGRAFGLVFAGGDGGTGGAVLYLLNALSGAGMAAAFSPLMTRVLLRVPVEALSIYRLVRIISGTWTFVPSDRRSPGGLSSSTEF